MIVHENRLLATIWKILEKPRAEPRFLEMGLISIKVRVALQILSHFSELSHEDEIIWSH